MIAKIFSYILIACTVCCIACSTKNNQNNAANAQNGTDSLALTKSIEQPSASLCTDVLKQPSNNEEGKFASDSLQLGDKRLFFIKKDSIFQVYQQNAHQCNLIFETVVAEDPDSWPDGEKIKLEDINGDNQKDVFVRTFREKNYYNFCVFRIVEENGKIEFKKIKRIEELLNVRFDKKSGLIRSLWGQKGLEIDEYFKLTKDDKLTFVKGIKSVIKIDDKGETDVTDTPYTTKEGW